MLDLDVAGAAGVDRRLVAGAGAGDVDGAARRRARCSWAARSASRRGHGARAAHDDPLLGGAAGGEAVDRGLHRRAHVGAGVDGRAAAAGGPGAAAEHGLGLVGALAARRAAIPAATGAASHRGRGQFRGRARGSGQHGGPGEQGGGAGRGDEGSRAAGGGDTAGTGATPVTVAVLTSRQLSRSWWWRRWRWCRCAELRLCVPSRLLLWGGDRHACRASAVPPRAPLRTRVEPESSPSRVRRRPESTRVARAEPSRTRFDRVVHGRGARRADDLEWRGSYGTGPYCGVAAGVPCGGPRVWQALSTGVKGQAVPSSVPSRHSRVIGGPARGADMRVTLGKARFTYGHGAGEVDTRYQEGQLALEPVRFAVLGSVRVERTGAEPAWGRPQERALLALLLVRAGQPVAVSEIVDVLWGRRPPDSAVNVIRRHVGSLRRLLEPGLPNRAVGRWLIRDAGGYRLLVDADSLDLLRFRRLRDEARRVGGDAHGSPARAVELLTEALELWRGPVGAGLPAEVRERAGFGAVDRERRAALREAADAALRAGTPATVLPLLQEAAADDPLDEPLLARLVLTLAATGREAEALSTYRTASARLADELGIDPGPELRDAHETVVRGAGSPAPAPASSSAGAGTGAGAGAGPGPPPDPPAPAPGAPGAPAAVPAQLPHDLPTFTGRRAELERVLALLTGHGGAGGGRGDSDGHGAQCRRRRCRRRQRRPAPRRHRRDQRHRRYGRHRQDHARRALGPSGRGPVPGRAALRQSAGLRAVRCGDGARAKRCASSSTRWAYRRSGVPHGVDAQAALYRSLLAGRRFLVLLDNARDTEQVRPLLPGTPGCLTIVTSRDQLSGLVSAHGAHTLALRPLDAGQARVFLERRLGAGRLAGEERAVAEIAALCGGLPLALACVAARAAAHPGFPLSAIAAELRAAHGSLDAFSRADASANVGAVFSWSLGARIARGGTPVPAARAASRPGLLRVRDGRAGRPARAPGAVAADRAGRRPPRGRARPRPVRPPRPGARPRGRTPGGPAPRRASARRPPSGCTRTTCTPRTPPSSSSPRTRTRCRPGRPGRRPGRTARRP